MKYLAHIVSSSIWPLAYGLLVWRLVSAAQNPNLWSDLALDWTEQLPLQVSVCWWVAQAYQAVVVSHPVHSGWRKLAFVLLWELKLGILAVVGVAP